MDNETASISVTRTYPVFQVAAGTANSSGGSSVNYSNVGTILHVTPRISANDYIWLRVLPEVSSFFGTFSATIGGQIFQAPQFDSRSVQTDVLVPNSNTLVIGGLVQDNPHADYTKVPLLGDVPGLGFLFRSSSKSMSKDNLLIFITPTIVRDSDFQTAQSTDFLKSKSLPTKQPMDPNTAWDSPVPKGQWIDPITETTK
jgi:general secretion pathway protein D